MNALLIIVVIGVVLYSMVLKYQAYSLFGSGEPERLAKILRARGIIGSVLGLLLMLYSAENGSSGLFVLGALITGVGVWAVGSPETFATILAGESDKEEESKKE